MLNDFIQIRKKILVISLSSSEIIGSFIIVKGDINILKGLSNSCVDEFVKIDSKNVLIDNIIEGQEITITLFPRRINNGLYFEDLEQLVQSFSQNFPSKPYYIYSLNYHSEHEPKPQEITNYENIIKLISLIENISDYKKTVGNIQELVFFQSKKLVIQTIYNSYDLVSIQNISNLESQFTALHDNEERKTIFINELINSLLYIEDTLRFPTLIKSFDDIYTKYLKGHKFYLEQFSFEKIKSELDNEKMEYAQKLQDVINSVQTKLISIPAAFLLIISQFDIKGEKLLLNISLLLSAFIFSYLLDILIKNQFTSLSVIDEDIKNFKKRFQEKNEKIPLSDFESTFNKLDTLQLKQKRNLNIIRLIIWLVAAFSIVLFVISILYSEIICFCKLIYSLYVS